MVYRPSPSDSAVRRVPTTLTPTRATGVPVSRARTTPAIAPLESWAVAPPAAASNAAQPIRQTRIVLMRNAPNGSEARPQPMRRARDGERRTTRSAAPTVRYGQPVPVQRTRLPLLFVDRTKVPAAPPMRAQGARQGGARTPHRDPEPSQTIVRTINTRDFSRATRSTSRQINRLILLNLVREIQDRKSTRLNSSHSQISYAVFCLKKKKKHAIMPIGGAYSVDSKLQQILADLGVRYTGKGITGSLLTFYKICSTVAFRTHYVHSIY